MAMFKSDVQSVRLFRGYSYADAVATGRLLCQWYADKSGAIRQSVALSDGRRHGSGNLAHQATEGSKGPVFPGNSVIIFLAPYPFSTLRIFIKILSSFDNILYINTVTSRMTQALCAAARRCAHWKQVSNAAGNWTFRQRFVNIENLSNGRMDSNKIWC